MAGQAGSNVLITEDQAQIRDTARDFAQQRLAPFAAEWDRTIQTLGGYVADFDGERIYRGVRVTRICEGTNDIQRLVISRALGAEARQEGRG